MSGVLEEPYQIKPQHRHVKRFLIQWAAFSVIGTLAFFAFLRLDGHFHFRLPLAGSVVLMPAYFPLGFVDGTNTAFHLAVLVALLLDAMYYGLVLLIMWRGLSLLVKRTGSRPKSA